MIDKFYLTLQILKNLKLVAKTIIVHKTLSPYGPHFVVLDTDSHYLANHFKLMIYYKYRQI